MNDNFSSLGKRVVDPLHSGGKVVYNILVRVIVDLDEHPLKRLETVRGCDAVHDAEDMGYAFFLEYPSSGYGVPC